MGRILITWGVHVHVGVGSVGSRLGLLGLLLLSGLSALAGKSLCLLLLLNAWSRRSRRGLEVHLRLEWTSELLLRDKGMSASLLWGPSLQGIKVQQSMDKVNKGDSVVHF